MPPTLVLPYLFAHVGLRTPAAHLDADFQAVADWLNTYGATIGPLALRPAPLSAGAIYVSQDERHLWYIADGTTWHPVGRLGPIDVDSNGNIKLYGAAVGAGAKDVIACGPATGIPARVVNVAQLFVRDTMSEAGRAAWHQQTEDGWLAPLDRVLFRAVGNPAIIVSNTAAETSLFLKTLDANTLGLGGVSGLEPRGLEIALALDILNNTGATRTVTLRLKLGGQLGYTSVMTCTTSGTRRLGAMTFRVDPGLTAAAQVFSPVLYQWEPTPTEVRTPVTTTQNVALPLTFEVTAQLSLASANLALRLFSAHVGMD